MSTTMQVPATISVPEAGAALGLARDASYRAAKRGEIPTIKVGGKIRVPTHRLLELLNGGATAP